jgi:hypothetical protein
MATAQAGSNITLMFGGNGHSRGDFGGERTGDAGTVSVYWGGMPEKELLDVQDLNQDTLVQTNGFAEESFSWPANKSVVSPPELKDKGNWQTVILPDCMAPGRHMMVWVWEFGGAMKFSTCFDVMIGG